MILPLNPELEGSKTKRYSRRHRFLAASVCTPELRKATIWWILMNHFQSNLPWRNIILSRKILTFNPDPLSIFWLFFTLLWYFSCNHERHRSFRMYKIIVFPWNALQIFKDNRKKCRKITFSSFFKLSSKTRYPLVVETSGQKPPLEDKMLTKK